MPALFITGFHRSGTSMVAELFKVAGLHVGRALLGANESNLRGHFEDVEIVALHDSILERRGTNWLFCDEVPLHLNDSDRGRLRTLALAREQLSTLWGFKDPRASLFLTEWLHAVPGANCFILYRHWTECIASLFRRHTRTLLASSLSSDADLRLFQQPEVPARSWLAYNRRLLAVREAFPERCLVASQSAIVSGYPILAEAASRFSLNLEIAASGIVDRSLVHHEATQAVPDWIPPGLREELDVVWEKLQAVSIAPASETQRETATVPSPGIVPPPQEEALNVPEHQTATECLALAKERLVAGTPETALEWAREGIARDDGVAGCWTSLGEAHLALGDLPRAERAFLRAIALAPERAVNHDGVARTLIGEGHYREALRFATTSVLRAPSNPRWRITKLRAHGTLGQFELAREELRELTQLAPAMPWLRVAAAALDEDTCPPPPLRPRLSAVNAAERERAVARKILDERGKAVFHAEARRLHPKLLAT